MATKTLFSTKRSNRAKPTNTVNDAGASAYKLSDAEALCQYVATSCFNGTYYTSERDQLANIARLCNSVPSVTIAKAAVYGRENAKMKDTPAYLLAHLTAKNETELVKKIFNRVIDNPKMLLNYVQIVRSGATGRKSFGSAAKNLINNWITSRYGNKLFRASIGKSDPSFVDVLRMTHPRPVNDEQNALFGYLLGKDHDAEKLPPLVKEFEAFKADNSNPMPNLDYRALTNCNLTVDHWKQVAINMPWNATRMNLNVLNKHGVFSDKKVLNHVAKKLANAEEVKKNNAFPYQLLTTFHNTETLPSKINLALQDAMEIATENVPVLGDRVAVCVDVSGSMSSPITGYRRGSSTKTRCVDVAAMFASAIARTNQEATIVSFGDRARVVPGFNPRDSVASNANRLVSEARYCGHGTNGGATMECVNKNGSFDMVVVLSDMQMWVGHSRIGWGATPLNAHWANRRNKKGKLATINLVAGGTSQVDSGDPSVMCFGGFSDAVFDILGEFAHRNDNANFADVVDRIEL